MIVGTNSIRKFISLETKSKVSVRVMSHTWDASRVEVAAAPAQRCDRDITTP